MRVYSSVPTFPVRDVAAAVRWYIEHLDFEVGGTFPKDPPYFYASMHFGVAEIMFLSLEGYEKPDLASRRPAGLWDAYIRMDGVRALYERHEGKPYIRMPLKLQPYNNWEFEVIDPFGNILTFGGGEK